MEIQHTDEFKRSIANVIDLDNFDADQLIEQYKGLQVNGYFVLIFIYKPPIITKTAGNLLLPDNAIELDYEYRSTVGLVLNMGPEAYQGERFTQGPWCKVGDWVSFPRANGVQYRYDHALVLNVPDDKIINVIDNPKRITR